MAKSLKKKSADFALGFALFYVLACSFLYFNQRNLMYFPHGDELQNPALSGIYDYEYISPITEGGDTLNGWFQEPGTAGMPVIVFFHGNGVPRGIWYWKLGAFLKQGYGALYAEYPGYAGNAGELSEGGIYDAARGYIHWLIKDKGFAEKDIVLYGESLGTGVAVQMATEFSVRAVILESPYTSTADIAKLQYFFFPVDLLMKDQYRSIDKVHRMHEPLFVLHGNKDTVVPIRFGKKLFEAAVGAQNKYFLEVEGAGHESVFSEQSFQQVITFLRGVENSGQIQGVKSDSTK